MQFDNSRGSVNEGYDDNDKESDNQIKKDSCNGERNLSHVQEFEIDGELHVDASGEAFHETVNVRSPILYKISEAPPIYLTLFFGVQLCLLSVVGAIILPLLVADAACAPKNEELIRKLLGTTMMMNGISTLTQCLFGVRLPVFQGPSSGYVVPLLSLNQVFKDRCNATAFYIDTHGSDLTNISTTEMQDSLEDTRIRELIGPLMVAGGVHAFVGLTGIVGLLLRFVGPITIVPTILLIGIYFTRPIMTYVEPHWGLSFLTWAIGIILSLYLGHRPMPIPIWTKKKGFRIIRYPLHQVFAILIAMMIGWAVSGITTSAGAFTDDKDDVQFMARTDARSNIVGKTPWFFFPYPGQFGSPKFSVSVLVGFLIATITSILDSIGEYSATAATCRVPPPPRHAVNRGITIEGLCSMMSGAMGSGHATTTYGGTIGAIGMTRVASRQVFVCTSILYIVFAIIAKISAVFVSIPYPVLGGASVTIVSVFVGVNLSNLRVVDLASTRNLSIIGTGVFLGLLIPEWIEKHNDAIQTGYSGLDQVMSVLLSNPNFFGAFVSCVLDNTVPGTLKERGITAWTHPEQMEDSAHPVQYVEGVEVYEPYMAECLKKQSWLRFIPILPAYTTSRDKPSGV